MADQRSLEDEARRAGAKLVRDGTLRSYTEAEAAGDRFASGSRTNVDQARRLLCAASAFEGVKAYSVAIKMHEKALHAVARAGEEEANQLAIQAQIGQARATSEGVLARMRAFHFSGIESEVSELFECLQAAQGATVAAATGQGGRSKSFPRQALNGCAAMSRMSEGLELALLPREAAEFLATLVLVLQRTPALREPNFLPWRAEIVLRVTRRLVEARKEDEGRVFGRSQLDDVMDQVNLEATDHVPMPQWARDCYEHAKHTLRMACSRWELRQPKSDCKQRVESLFPSDRDSQCLALLEAIYEPDATVIFPAASSQESSAAVQALEQIGVPAAQPQLEESGDDGSKAVALSEHVHAKCIRVCLSLGLSKVADGFLEAARARGGDVLAVAEAMDAARAHQSKASSGEPGGKGNLERASTLATKLKAGAKMLLQMSEREANQMGEAAWREIDKFNANAKENGRLLSDDERELIATCLGHLFRCGCEPLDVVSKARMAVEWASALEALGRIGEAHDAAEQGAKAVGGIPLRMPKYERASATCLLADLLGMQARLGPKSGRRSEKALLDLQFPSGHQDVRMGEKRCLEVKHRLVRALIQAEAAPHRDWDRVEQWLTSAANDVRACRLPGKEPALGVACFVQLVWCRIAKQSIRLWVAKSIRKEACWNALHGIVDHDSRLLSPAELLRRPAGALRCSAEALLVASECSFAITRPPGKGLEGCADAASAAALALAAGDKALAAEAAACVLARAKPVLFARNKSMGLAPALGLAAITGCESAESLPGWASSACARIGCHGGARYALSGWSKVGLTVAQACAKGARGAAGEDAERLEMHLALSGGEWSAPEGDFQEALKALSQYPPSGASKAWEQAKASPNLKKSDRVLEVASLLVERAGDAASALADDALTLAAESRPKVDLSLESSGVKRPEEDSPQEDWEAWSKNVLAARVPHLWRRRIATLEARRRRVVRAPFHARLLSASAAAAESHEPQKQQQQQQKVQTKGKKEGKDEGAEREHQSAHSTPVVRALKRFSAAVEIAQRFAHWDEVGAAASEAVTRARQAFRDEEPAESDLGRELYKMASTLIEARKSVARPKTVGSLCELALECLAEAGLEGKAYHLSEMIAEQGKREALPHLTAALEKATQQAKASDDGDLEAKLQQALNLTQRAVKLHYRHLQRARQAETPESALREAKLAHEAANKRGERLALAESYAEMARALAAMEELQAAEDRHANAFAVASGCDKPRNESADWLANSLGERRIFAALASGGWLAFYGIEGGPNGRLRMARDCAQLAAAWWKCWGDVLPEESWLQGEWVPQPEGALADPEQCDRVSASLMLATQRLLDCGEPVKTLPVSSLAEGAAWSAGKDAVKRARALRAQCLAQCGRLGPAAEALGLERDNADSGAAVRAANEEDSHEKKIAAAEWLIAGRDGKAAQNCLEGLYGARAALARARALFVQWQPEKCEEAVDGTSDVELEVLSQAEGIKCRALVLRGFPRHAIEQSHSLRDYLERKDRRAFKLTPRLTIAEGQAHVRLEKNDDAAQLYARAAAQASELEKVSALVSHGRTLARQRMHFAATKPFHEAAQAASELAEAGSVDAKSLLRGAVADYMDCSLAAGAKATDALPKEGGEWEKWIGAGEASLSELLALGRVQRLAGRDDSAKETLEHALQAKVGPGKEDGPLAWPLARQALCELALLGGVKERSSPGRCIFLAARMACFESAFDERPSDAIEGASALVPMLEAAPGEKAQRKEGTQESKKKKEGKQQAEKSAKSGSRKEAQRKQDQTHEQVLPVWATEQLERAGLSPATHERLAHLLRWLINDPLEADHGYPRARELHHSLQAASSDYKEAASLPSNPLDQSIPAAWEACLVWMRAEWMGENAGSDDPHRADTFILLGATREGGSADEEAGFHCRAARVVSAPEAKGAHEAAYRARKVAEGRGLEEGEGEGLLAEVVSLLAQEGGSQEGMPLPPDADGLRQLEAVLNPRRHGGALSADAARWFRSAFGSS